MEPTHEASGERVLVTGATGFTGRYVVAELQRTGHDVHGLVHRQPDATSGQITCADLLDPDAIARVVARIRPTAVIHLAAKAFTACQDVEAIYRTNIVGTRNLLTALASLRELPHTVILASSANVYGGASEGKRAALDETAPTRPENDYAVSKLAMEHMARLWTDRLPLVVTRPFNYTGVGQQPNFLVPKIVARYRRGARSIELGNLDVWRSFSDVRAVAWSYSQLLGRGSPGEIYNICPDEVCSVREILSMMERIAGYTIEVRVNPDFVRTGEARRLTGDDAKLRRAIGNPPRYGLVQTLRWMYDA